jgi:hypothetical protein
VNTLVAEEGLAPPAAPDAGLIVVPRSRGRRGWGELDPDAVVDALDRAGPGAVVLARTPAADLGARALPALAEIMGREIVRLPADRDAAAWVVAVAGGRAEVGADPARPLQVLVGAAGAPVLPRRPVGAGSARVPALRPGVLVRWARCAWRPCARCAGGGLSGASCGRCGAGLVAGAPR